MKASELKRQLDRIEDLLSSILEERQVKDWYTTEEFAKLVGKAEYTVREACRLGRLDARKQTVPRQGGRHAAWAISHAELLRYRRDGLLPDPAARIRTG